MTAKCDTCATEFEPHIRKRKEDGVETIFFLCPSCETQTVVCKTNPEIRKIEQRIKNERRRLDAQRSRGDLDVERLTNLRELIQDHKTALDRLNGRGSDTQETE